MSCLSSQYKINDLRLVLLFSLNKASNNLDVVNPQYFKSLCSVFYFFRIVFKDLCPDSVLLFNELIGLKKNACHLKQILAQLVFNCGRWDYFTYGRRTKAEFLGSVCTLGFPYEYSNNSKDFQNSKDCCQCKQMSCLFSSWLIFFTLLIQFLPIILNVMFNSQLCCWKNIGYSQNRPVLFFREHCQVDSGTKMH